MGLVATEEALPDLAILKSSIYGVSCLYKTPNFLVAFMRPCKGRLEERGNLVLTISVWRQTLMGVLKMKHYRQLRATARKGHQRV